MNEGDVVVLKSGGPDMTIESIDATVFANLVWFHPDTNELQRARIPLAALEAATP